MPEEKKIGGKACPIEFFFFFFDKAIMILILVNYGQNQTIGFRKDVVKV